jgi:hypothetical protein
VFINKALQSGRDARAPRYFYAKEHWSTYRPARHASRRLAYRRSFLTAQAAFASMTVHCARSLNFIANQEIFCFSLFCFSSVS